MTAVIVQRYIIVEVARYFAALAVGLFLLVVSMRATGYLADAAEGRIAAGHIVQLLGLKIGISLKDMLPLALYLAVFVALGRLQRDNELTVMRAVGFRDRTLFGAVAGVALPVALGVGALALFGVDAMERALVEIEQRAEDEATVAGIRAGRFQELADGERVFYAEAVSDDQRALRNAFVQARDGNQAGLLRAEHARLQYLPEYEARYAVFEHGTSYAGQPGERNYAITAFGRYAVRLEFERDRPPKAGLETQPSSALLGAGTLAARAEYEYRLAMPVATMVLALTAVGMAQSQGRGRFRPGIVSAIAIFFIYTNLLGMSRAMFAAGTTPAFLGTWWVHLAFATVGAMLYLYTRRQARP